jgi:hypothetical protein
MLEKVVSGFTEAALARAREAVEPDERGLLTVIGHAERLVRHSMSPVFIASDGEVTGAAHAFKYDDNRYGFINRFHEMSQIYDALLKRHLAEEDFLIVTTETTQLSAISTSDWDTYQRSLVADISSLRQGGKGSVIFSLLPIKIQTVSRGTELPQKLELIRREIASTVSLPYSYLFGQPLNTGRSGLPSNETDYQESIIAGLSSKFVAASERFRRVYAK